MKNNFLRIKFNDAGDESLSHTLKAYHLIDKLLEKTDHKYTYEIDSPVLPIQIRVFD